MNFEVSELGNRIIIKTKKNNNITKITPLVYKKALITIMNLQDKGHEVSMSGDITDYRIKSLF